METDKTKNVSHVKMTVKNVPNNAMLINLNVILLVINVKIQNSYMMEIA